MTDLASRLDRRERAGENGRSRRDMTAPPHATHRRAEVDSRRAARERDVRDRVIGHAVVGAGAFIMFVALLPIIGSLATFTLAIVALYVGLRSFTLAISIWLGDPWGWTRDGGLSTLLSVSDRVALAGVRWFRLRAAAAVEGPTAGAIRVLPPGSTK